MMPSAIHISYDGKEHTSGLCSAASWKQPHMMNVIRALFVCKKNERIVGIRVDEVGITAYFEYIEPDSPAR